MSTVKELLKENNLTIKDISVASSISETTLSATFKRPVETWSVKVLTALANVLYMKLDDLMQILAPKKFQLDIDEDKKTIQGVKIPENLFVDMKDIVKYSVMEGWEPTREEITYLLERSKYEDPLLIKELNDIWGK